MSIQRIGCEYINGVPAINNLVNTIEAEIKDVGIHFYRKPKFAGWD